MEYRDQIEDRFSDVEGYRNVPSFLEAPPPLISNPFMRPRPVKGRNLLEEFDEESDLQDQELLQVYLRLKPCPGSNLYEIQSDNCLVTSLDTATAGHGRRTQLSVTKIYTFSHIFKAECSQKEVFDKVVKENLKKLPEGNNFTLLTYGASGSGKTFTLMGTVRFPGLVPRSLEYVFKLVDAAQLPTYKPAEGCIEKLNQQEQMYELQLVKQLRKITSAQRDKYKRMSVLLQSDLTASTLDLSQRKSYYVWVSFVEIYNEAVYDLLANTNDRKNATKLRIREDNTGNFYVQGAKQLFVRSGQEAYDIMVAGKHNLQVAATGIHAQSSRSHCIFTITMLTEMDGAIRASYVRLCDLAGCERAQRTRNTGARMQESRAINSSLHVLERCVHVLRRNQGKKLEANLVPFRESKLTRLLGAGLSGARGEAVSMVVTVNPSQESVTETRHVLQLAAVARNLHVNNTNAEFDSMESSTQDTTAATNDEIMRLRAENERLYYEMFQLEKRNKDLTKSINRQQQENAKTTQEFVDEARDITKEYYELQLQALKTEMENMRERYEARIHCLNKANIAGTPIKLQNKVAQMMQQLTIAEENLNSEKLARARVEEELLHLRRCIEERDIENSKSIEEIQENTFSNEGVVVVSDSENGSDDEIGSESLESNYRKETNRSKARLSVTEISDTISKASDVTTEESDFSSDEDNDRNITVRESIYSNNEVTQSFNVEYNNSNGCEKVKKVSRETYHVVPNDSIPKNGRGTFFVKDSSFLSPKTDDITKDQKQDFKMPAENPFININKKPLQSKISELSPLMSSDTSLIQFEQLERDALTGDNQLKEHELLHTKHGELLSNVNMLKHKKTYFDEFMYPKIKPCKPELVPSNITLFKQDTMSVSNKTLHKQEAMKASNKTLSKQDTMVVSNRTLAKQEVMEASNKIIPEQESMVASNKTLLVQETFVASNRTLAKQEVMVASNKILPEQEAVAASCKTLPEKQIMVASNKSLLEQEVVVDSNKTLPVQETFVASNRTLAKQEVMVASNKILPEQEAMAVSCKPLPEQQIMVASNKSLLEQEVVVDSNKTLPEQETFVASIRTLAKQEVMVASNKILPEQEAMAASCKTLPEQQIMVASNKSLLEQEVVVDSNKTLPAQETFVASNRTLAKQEVMVACNKILPEQEAMAVSCKTLPEQQIMVASNKSLLEQEVVVDSNKTNLDQQTKNYVRSPFIVKDDIPPDYKPSTTKKFLGDSLNKTCDIHTIVKSVTLSKLDNSIDIFGANSPLIDSKSEDVKTSSNAEPILQEMTNDVEMLINKIEEPIKIKNEYETCQINENITDTKKNEQVKNENNSKTNEVSLISSLSQINLTNNNGNNTTEYFENLCKDLAARETEFEILLSSSTKNKIDGTSKYNLRKKTFSTTESTDKENDVEIVQEAQAHCAAKKSTKKNLRLRKKKTENDAKLKDIANLQKEFSDVVLDIPVPAKVVKDIESPEMTKQCDKNNLPSYGMSCPSKSITRSRRKLFTPQPEALDQSMGTSDSSERLYIPRPSYHRSTRARRKL